jgi:hypothetical protein
LRTSKLLAAKTRQLLNCLATSIRDSNMRGMKQSAGIFLMSLVTLALTPVVTHAEPWTQQAYIKASNTGANDHFGRQVAVSGNTMVVSAPEEDSNATGINGNQTNNNAGNAGAAYVFVRSGANWVQQAYLKASNTGGGDLFGWSVAISGDTIVVGAQREDSNATGVNASQSNNNAADSGAAYVFVRSGTTWTQQAYLKASNAEIFDGFGVSVAISGDIIVVGAPFEGSSATGVNGEQDNNDISLSGAAYVFVRSGSTWSQQAYLKSSNNSPGIGQWGGDGFGWSVAASGETIVVGAINEDSNATGVNGNQNDNSLEDVGAAYVFVRNGATWTQQAYLKPLQNGGFGETVAISGDTAAIGFGAHVFLRHGTNWEQPVSLPGGPSVSVSGPTVATSSGVFTYSGIAWNEQTVASPPNGEAGDYFGYTIALSGNILIIGAEYEDSNAVGVNGNQSNNSAMESGAVYVYTYSPPALASISMMTHTPAGLQLTLPVAPGQNVGVQYSETLSTGTWLDIGDFSVAGGLGTFTDSQPLRLSRPRGYYRGFLR